MPFEVSKIYTENPYVDEMVYYTKIIAMGTVLKMQQQADNCETLESLKRAGIYISAIEGTATLDLFPSISVTALKSAGIIDPLTVALCIKDRNNIPLNRRATVVKTLSSEYIENYEELNTYYNHTLSL